VELIRAAGRHGYEEAILFGHAKDGNLHLTITQSYNTQAEVDRYARFMDDMVRLDIYYIENWSLWLDLKILLRTVPVVLFGSGAY
jgi:lipopolysaccharide/colanic/teichoic acid biosynthesis glycosyltransferase